MSVEPKTEEAVDPEVAEFRKRFPRLSAEERAKLTPEQRRRRAYEMVMALRGTIHFDIDLDELRGRRR